MLCMNSCVWLWYSSNTTAIVLHEHQPFTMSVKNVNVHSTVTCTMEIEYLNLRNMNQVESCLSKQSLQNKNNESKNESSTNDCRTSTFVLLIYSIHTFVWKKTWLQSVFSKPNFLSQNQNFLCRPDNQKWASSMHRAATKLYLLWLEIFLDNISDFQLKCLLHKLQQDGNITLCPIRYMILFFIPQQYCDLYHGSNNRM